jgi:hypothetical protein
MLRRTDSLQSVVIDEEPVVSPCAMLTVSRIGPEGISTGGAAAGGDHVNCRVLMGVRQFTPGV